MPRAPHFRTALSARMATHDIRTAHCRRKRANSHAANPNAGKMGSRTTAECMDKSQVQQQVPPPLAQPVAWPSMGSMHVQMARSNFFRFFCTQGLRKHPLLVPLHHGIIMMVLCHHGSRLHWRRKGAAASGCETQSQRQLSSLPSTNDNDNDTSRQ